MIECSITFVLPVVVAGFTGREWGHRVGTGREWGHREGNGREWGQRVGNGRGGGTGKVGY